MTEPQGNGGACPCYATNVAYRTDSPSARSFLAPYVDLP